MPVSEHRDDAVAPPPVGAARLSTRELNLRPVQLTGFKVLRRWSTAAPRWWAALRKSLIMERPVGAAAPVVALTRPARGGISRLRG
jgi:hypothetical protein